MTGFVPKRYISDCPSSKGSQCSQRDTLAKAPRNKRRRAVRERHSLRPERAG